jgi:hypothetical protein
VPARLASHAEDVLIDNVSLTAFITEDPAARRLDEEIASWSGWGLNDRPDPTSLVAQLQHVGLSTIADLKRAMDEHGRIAVRQFQERVRRTSSRPGYSVARGIGLFHLFQVLAARDGLPRLVETYEKFEIGSPRRSRETHAEEVIRAIAKARGAAPGSISC